MNAYLKEANAEIAAPEQHDLLIDGRRVPAISGRYFDSIDPATEQLIGRIAEGGAEDIDVAVRSARAAFEDSWSGLPGRDRGRYCWHLPTRFARMRMNSLNSKALIQENRYRRFGDKTSRRCLTLLLTTRVGPTR